MIYGHPKFESERLKYIYVLKRLEDGLYLSRQKKNPKGKCSWYAMPTSSDKARLIDDVLGIAEYGYAVLNFSEEGIPLQVKSF